MRLFLLPLLFLSAVAYGQERFMTDTVLKGTTFTKRNDQVYLLQSRLSIVGTDGSSHEITTDEEGQFYFSNQHITPGNSYVITVGSYHKTGLYFMNTTYKFTSVGLSDFELPEIKNFELDVNHGCGGLLPSMSFERNSFDINEFNQSLLTGLLENLNDNPTIVLEICGRANSDEKNPAELAENRANAIHRKLLAMGVDSARLVPSNHADTLYYVAEWRDYEFGYRDTLNHDHISRLTDPKVIEKARLLDSLVLFKVIRNDYVPKDD